VKSSENPSTQLAIHVSEYIYSWKSFHNLYMLKISDLKYITVSDIHHVDCLLLDHCTIAEINPVFRSKMVRFVAMFVNLNVISFTALEHLVITDCRIFGISAFNKMFLPNLRNLDRILCIIEEAGLIDCNRIETLLASGWLCYQLTNLSNVKCAIFGLFSGLLISLAFQ
jgi:hypothetical protein